MKNGLPPVCRGTATRKSRRPHQAPMQEAVAAGRAFVVGLSDRGDACGLGVRTCRRKTRRKPVSHENEWTRADPRLGASYRSNLYSLEHAFYKLETLARSKAARTLASVLGRSRLGSTGVPLELFDIVTVVAPLVQRCAGVFSCVGDLVRDSFKPRKPLLSDWFRGGLRHKDRRDVPRNEFGR